MARLTPMLAVRGDRAALAPPIDLRAEVEVFAGKGCGLAVDPNWRDAAAWAMAAARSPGCGEPRGFAVANPAAMG